MARDPQLQQERNDRIRERYQELSGHTHTVALPDGRTVQLRYTHSQKLQVLSKEFFLSTKRVDAILVE